MADTDLYFYSEFGLGKGSVGQLIGPKVWASGLRAFLHGSGAGVPVGDVRIMSGTFLVEGDRVLREHFYRHSGDHPDFRAIAAPVPA